MTDARKFLETVLVWPGSPQAPGWVNLHVNAKNDEPAKNGGKPWVVGWPFKTVDDVLNRISWVESTDTFFNVWVCMSQQSECTQKANGKAKAVRKAANATWLKAIWIDCDVKAGDPKHYHTMTEAFDALDAFRNKVGLPFPSVIVNSGGGLHMYWVADAAMSVDEWRPYADGLKALLLREGIKCDTGLTTDVARILRVPGTLNHKYSPPRPVELLHCGTSYNFQSDLQFLTQFNSSASITPHGEQPKIVTEPIEPGAVFDAPDVAFAALTPDNALQAGKEPTTPFLVDPAPIFAKDGCRWLRHALKTGGADFDNPQWNLSVLCTAFMENGNAFAHAISEKHTTYAAPDTQALFDRKVADRADRGIGYPSCAAIAGAGSEHCKACPHFQKGKSPLNIRPVVTATVTAPGQSKLQLPEGYAVKDDRVYLVEKKVSKGEIIEEWKLLFHNKIIDAYAEKDPDVLNLHISLDKGNWAWVSLRLSDVAGAGYEKNLTALQLLYTEHKLKIEAFVMSFMSKMKEAAELQKSMAFGWYRPKGPIEGFSYGGYLIRPDGSSSPAALNDPMLRARYTPSGSAANWHHVASYILRQKRQDLDAILAVAFAGPLMSFTGAKAAVLAAMGEAGSGKTYAMKIAAAVWGKHDETIENKKTTDKSFLHNLGQINNLPAFWNEVSDPVVQPKFLEAQMVLDTGGEGNRLTQQIKMQRRLTWCTLVNINGNRSWRDYVLSQQKDHGAGLRRVLEYTVTKDVLNPQGQVPASESDKALVLLDSNFGQVGMEYVTYLVTHLDQVQQIIDRNTKIFEQKLQPAKEENMWLAACVTLQSGAEIANLLPNPVGFNTNRMFDFLLNVFLDNRRFLAASNVNPVDTAEDYLAQYLKDRFDEMIWTNGLPAQAGRPSKVEWARIQPNARTSRGISVRWDAMSMTLRFSKTNFEDWCLHKPDKRDPHVIARALTRIYNMTKERRMLAAGTPFKVLQEFIYTIDISPHQDLKDIMESFYAQTQINMNAELGTSNGAVGATGTHG